MQKTVPSCRRAVKHGGMSVVVIGFMFFLVMLAMVVVEVMRYSQTYSDIDTSLQRSINSAVETNMDYTYRADKLLKLYITAPSPYTDYEQEAGLLPGHGALEDFKIYLNKDLKTVRSGDTFTKQMNGQTIYILQITSWSGTDQTVCESPVLKISGTLTVWPIYSGLFGKAPIVKTFTCQSKDFRIDGL